VDVTINPGTRVAGEAKVPGDKSIAHRWLILASTARGGSELRGLPASLDVRSTARCLAQVAPKARPALEVWAGNASSAVEGRGSTWNPSEPDHHDVMLEVEGEGREGLVLPDGELDCGNSGTSMRLLAGVLAGAPFTSILTGDESLSGRPMERVAEPLRLMGAGVTTTEGRAPMRVHGGGLRGIDYEIPVASAQVKGAILLAAMSADGATTVHEPAPVRDHTERALRGLGCTVETLDGTIVARPCQHDGFATSLPGDPSSAAFVLAAAALTGGEITITDVGLNPSRLHFLEVFARLGIEVRCEVDREELGEPVGSMHLAAIEGLRPVRVEPHEIPLIIDEIPILAAVAAHAPGDSWFLDTGELRIKESDRLAAIATQIRALGGHAAEEGDDLVLAGGGLTGGRGDAVGDHRMAMALTVAALAASTPSTVRGMEAADVSFPGFVAMLSRLGADLEAGS